MSRQRDVNLCFDLMEAQKEEIAQLKAEKAELMKAVGQMDRPYPVQAVLRILADGIDHLLNDHSCDAQGHEQLSLCRNLAREYADIIDSAIKAAD